MNTDEEKAIAKELRAVVADALQAKVKLIEAGGQHVTAELVTVALVQMTAASCYELTGTLANNLGWVMELLMSTTSQIAKRNGEKFLYTLETSE